MKGDNFYHSSEFFDLSSSPLKPTYFDSIIPTGSIYLLRVSKELHGPKNDLSEDISI